MMADFHYLLTTLSSNASILGQRRYLGGYEGWVVEIAKIKKQGATSGIRSLD